MEEKNEFFWGKNKNVLTTMSFRMYTSTCMQLRKALYWLSARFPFDRGEVMHILDEENENIEREVQIRRETETDRQTDRDRVPYARNATMENKGLSWLFVPGMERASFGAASPP